MRLDAEDLGSAAFGGFDGLVSLLGVLAGLILAHSSTEIVAAACFAMAAANTWSMGSGQYTSDTHADGRVRRALLMAVATLIGNLAPAIPIILAPGLFGILLAILIVVVLAAVIAHLRPDHAGARAYVQTYLFLGIGCLIAVGAAKLGVVAG